MLKQEAKARNLPSTGTKAVLMQRLGTSIPASVAGGKRKCAPSGTSNVSSQTRVPIKLPADLCKKMGLTFVKQEMGANGRLEYIYKKNTASDKKQKTTASTNVTCKGGACKIQKGGTDKIVSDAALEEAIACFVERLDEKSVPVDVCRKMLRYFLPPCEIPKDKEGVFEALAEQTHYETGSEGESDDEEDDDDDGSCSKSASDDGDSDDESGDSDDESGDSDDESGDSDDESGDSDDESGDSDDDDDE